MRKNNNGIHYFCCCCGMSLPGTRAELVLRGCATLQGNGQVIFHCNAGRHSASEIQDMIRATPTFVKASEYRKYLL